MPVGRTRVSRPVPRGDGVVRGRQRVGAGELANAQVLPRSAPDQRIRRSAFMRRGRTPSWGRRTTRLPTARTPSTSTPTCRSGPAITSSSWVRSTRPLDSAASRAPALAPLSLTSTMTGSRTRWTIVLQRSAPSVIPIIRGARPCADSGDGVVRRAGRDHRTAQCAGSARGSGGDVSPEPGAGLHPPWRGGGAGGRDDEHRRGRLVLHRVGE